MDTYLLADKIVFDSKPDAVPYNYRISYKMAQICLVIAKSCRGRAGCSLVKLHIVCNALSTYRLKKELLDYVAGKTSFMIVRFDPAVNRALRYAVADKLADQLQNGTFKLTDRGKDYVRRLGSEEILLEEKMFLKELGTGLTNEKIEHLMSMWRYRNAED